MIQRCVRAAKKANDCLMEDFEKNVVEGNHLDDDIGNSDEFKKWALKRLS